MCDCLVPESSHQRWSPVQSRDTHTIILHDTTTSRAAGTRGTSDSSQSPSPYQGLGNLSVEELGAHSAWSHRT